MDNVLNITNGDSAVKVMREAGIPGVFLPWRDVLHEGPVPRDLSLEKLSEIRAQFIIDQGWGDPESIRNSFVERDRELHSYKNYSKVILWFEHDLYDQLQILQILDWFSENYKGSTVLKMICTEQYLGMATLERLKELQSYEKRITNGHLELAKKTWQAFRSHTPEVWHGMLNEDTSIFPFLKDAIVRLLEEYPRTFNGLSRTAKQALHIISDGETSFGRIFGRYQESEERRFLGDSSFWVILQELLGSNSPLLRLTEGKDSTQPISPDQKLSITPTGREVLAGKQNWLEMVEIDRWIGGVHLTSDNIWCWDFANGSLIKRD